MEVIQDNNDQKIISKEEPTIEKHKEENTTLNSDITNMYFWVVFYDQYGNELQRESLKYGSVPSYNSWLPEGFERWAYKNSKRDVGSFKAITGNTYFLAVCNNSPSSSGGGAAKNFFK